MADLYNIFAERNDLEFTKKLLRKSAIDQKISLYILFHFVLYLIINFTIHVL